MKRVLLNGPGSLSLEVDDKPGPGPGEVLIQVAACGICGSDLHAYGGEHPLVIYPVTPGHEFSGTVIGVGDGVEPDLAGTKVCVEPSLFCGRCPRCLSGRYNICDELKVLGFQVPGAMCERIAVPAHRVHLLPDGVGFDAGALAEPAAVGVHALSRAGISGGSTILVVGAGVIGLMVLKAAKDQGCRTIVVEGTPERVRRALDFGADEAHAFDEFEPIGATYDAVFECVGRPETIDLAVRAAPRGGTVVIVGVPPGPVPVPMALVQDGELDVKGTLMYMGEDFERALALIGGGAIRAEDFITHRVPLDEVERGYGLAADPAIPTLKVLLELRGGG